MDSINKLLENRKIIIYGVGNTGRKFYYDHKNSIDIYGCTSSDEEFEAIDNLKSINLTDISNDSYFIVICSIYYDEIRRYLLAKGYKPFRDFIKWEYFEAIYDLSYNKKLIVSVGQCEIYEIGEGLKLLERFRSNYNILYFDEHKVCLHYPECMIEEYHDCCYMLSFANLFLRPTVFRANVENDFKQLESHLKQNTVLKVSIFDFDSYWPQDIDKGRGLSKYYVTLPEHKISAYASRDQVIEKLVEDGKTPREILEIVSDISLFDENTILKNHARTIKRAELTDRTATIKMSDVVKNNYSMERLYCDRGHFNENMLKEYIKRVLEWLNIQYDDSIIDKNDLLFLYDQTSEFPIYPSTATILKLDFIDSNTKYRMIRYGGTTYVTFEEYIENITLYYKKARELLIYC